jgi:hypothetical protein
MRRWEFIAGLQRVAGLPKGRLAVSSAATVGPNRIVANHCVENEEHLAHHRHDDDLRPLAGGQVGSSPR